MQVEVARILDLQLLSSASLCQGAHSLANTHNGSRESTMKKCRQIKTARVLRMQQTDPCPQRLKDERHQRTLVGQVLLRSLAELTDHALARLCLERTHRRVAAKS